MTDSDQEWIESQQELLTQHRRRLDARLGQLARLGVAHAPPDVVLDIQEARADIARIKTVLRDHGVAVADLPDDAEEALPSLSRAEARLAALPLDTIPDVAPLPPGSRMPFGRNPLFTGRTGDLLALARILKGGATAAIGQIAAATGLGGIGKSQLAIEFAHRYGQHFAGGVFWLSFADPAVVSAEVAACAGALGLPHLDALTLDQQVARVRQEWQSPLPRLLIFDNCEEESLLAEWRPISGGCRVLVTCRRGTWDPALGVAALALDVLTRGESVALLRKLLEPTTDHRPRTENREPRTEDEDALHVIAAELGDLPLALHLAGSFLRRYRHAVTLAQYLDQLRSPALLKHLSLQSGGHSPTDHEQHVGRTFALSYDKLDARDPIDALAIKLLARVACFAPGEPVPRSLLLGTLPRKPAPQPGFWARIRDLLRPRARRPTEAPASNLQVEDATSRLVELGLLESEEDDHVLALHRLLAAFVRDIAADDSARTAVEEVMIEVAADLNEKGDPRPLAALRTHLVHITEVALEREDARAAELCNRLGYHLRMSGDLAGAQPYYQRALDIRERVLGAEHPDTATSLNNLGYLLDSRGDLASARDYYQRAFNIREWVLGADHPDTAQSLNNLGLLMQAQGDLEGARRYLQRALYIRERVLGAEHPDTAMSLNNLGYLFDSMGNLAGARDYYQRALDIHERVLGAEHPDTALSLNNLAILHADAGRFQEALPLMERALRIRETVFGPQHPDTQRSQQSLAAMEAKARRAREGDDVGVEGG